MQHVCTKNSKRWIQSKVKGFGLWRTASFVTGWLFLFIYLRRLLTVWYSFDKHLAFVDGSSVSLCFSAFIPTAVSSTTVFTGCFRSFRFTTNLYSCIASADEPVKGWTLWSGLHCRPCRHTFTLPLTWGHAVTWRSPSAEYTRPIHKLRELSFILMGHLDGNLNGFLMFDLHAEIELKCHCHVIKKKKKR